MIRIHKSIKAKTLGQFYVTISGNNGEKLLHSECVKTKQSAIKNIKAVAGIFGGVTISVTDCTGKKEKALLLW